MKGFKSILLVGFIMASLSSTVFAGHAKQSETYKMTIHDVGWYAVDIHPVYISSEVPSYFNIIKKSNHIAIPATARRLVTYDICYALNPGSIRYKRLFISHDKKRNHRRKMDLGKAYRDADQLIITQEKIPLSTIINIKGIE